jgi:DNA invertase Pin-like site-specific DNA recombinase
VYLRVSTAEQVDNFSLDTQERACLEFCMREGLEVVRIFRDEGESAKTANRPELQSMLNACAIEGRRSAITAVVVFRVDRLARAVEDYAAISGALQSLGIRVRSVGEAFDDSPGGKLVENVLAAFAQFDNDARSARTIEGMKEALRHGRWVWQPPLGYLRTAGNAPMSMIIDPEVAPLIRHGFDAIASRRLTRPEALDELTDLGLVTRKGNPLSPQMFGAILRKPIYAGRICKPEWDIDVAGDFEAIVEPDLFEAVQEVLDNRPSTASSRVRDNPDFPLRRIVLCGQCSSPLTGSWSTGRSRRRYPYYRCPHKDCRGTNVRKEHLEELLVARLDEMSLRPEMLDLLGEVVEDAWGERLQTSRATEKALQRRLSDVERRRNALTDAYLDGRGIDQQTYERQAQRLDGDEAELRNRLRAVATPESNLARAVDLAQAMLVDLPHCWNRLEPQHRPQFLNALYPTGLIYQGNRIGTAEEPWWMAVSEGEYDADEGLVPPSAFDWNRVWRWLEGVEEARPRLEPALKAATSADFDSQDPVEVTPSVDWNRGEETR